MNNIMKFAIGAGVTAVGIGVTMHYAKKCKERKYVEMTDVAGQAVVNDHKDDTPVQKVKNFAMKKAIKFMTFVMLNQNKIEAAATVLGLIGSAISVVNAIKEYSAGKKFRKRVDDMYVLLNTVNNNVLDVMAEVNETHLDMGYFAEILD